MGTGSLPQLFNMPVGQSEHRWIWRQKQSSTKVRRELHCTTLCQNIKPHITEVNHWICLPFKHHICSYNSHLSNAQYWKMLKPHFEQCLTDVPVLFSDILESLPVYLTSSPHKFAPVAEQEETRMRTDLSGTEKIWFYGRSCSRQFKARRHNFWTEKFQIAPLANEINQ